jgi:hypothetical protein
VRFLWPLPGSQLIVPSLAGTVDVCHVPATICRQMAMSRRRPCFKKKRRRRGRHFDQSSGRPRAETTESIDVPFAGNGGSSRPRLEKGKSGVLSERDRFGTKAYPVVDRNGKVC